MEVVNFLPVLLTGLVVLYHVWTVWSLLVSLVATLVTYVSFRLWSRGRVTRIPVTGQGIVITGCDTGIGHESALRLHSLGFTVFAGCLSADSDGGRRLSTQGSKRLHVITLDVTDDNSVERFRDNVTKNCPASGLLAVVNNAGINVMADIELATMEMYKRVAEVNQFGMIRVTKAFSPLVRKYKGRFVNVTSVKGRIAGTLDSTYTMTKWAGEAFSDILRREMARFGVKVIIFEPGDFGGLTGMLNDATADDNYLANRKGVQVFSELTPRNKLPLLGQMRRMERDLETAWNQATPEAQGAYGRDYIDALKKGIQGAGATCHSSLNPVLDAMVDAVTSESPQYRYLVDGSGSFIDKFCEVKGRAILFDPANLYNIEERFEDVIQHLNHILNRYFNPFTALARVYDPICKQFGSRRDAD